jgi:hypothetical protein
MMKIKGVFVAIILTAVLCISSNLSAYSGGSGTAGRPYQISTVADWQTLMATPTDWNKYFVLRTDIDLGELVLTPVGNTSTNFTGVLDGDYKIISHAVINQGRNDYIGLFGVVGTGGQIMNLGIEKVNVTGQGYVGGLVGNNTGTLTACYMTGPVTGTGNYVGGLVGANTGTLTACYATGTVRGIDTVGGLVGWSFGTLSSCYATGSVGGGTAVGGLMGSNTGTLTDCYANGSVSGTGNMVGGLVGGTGGTGSTVTACHATGTVSGGGVYVGGLAGMNQNTGMLTACYATGTVNGSICVGGLAGENYSGTITSCSAIGFVTGSGEVGGLVGKNWGGTLTACNASGLVIGSSDVGGLVGSNAGILTACYASGAVSGTGYGSGGVGGLAGRHDGGTINKCYSKGNVASGPDTPYVGGLTGVNNGTISNCCSTGNVTSGLNSGYIGGLVGVNGGGISNCYSTGNVSSGLNSSFLGGLVGANTGTLIGCFWDTQTSGQTTSAGGTGKTTAEMNIPATFTLVGWDFTNVWGIIQNQTYPYLQTRPSADLNGDNLVNMADFAIFAGQWLTGN